MEQEDLIQEVTDVFVKYQELLNSDKKLTLKEVKEILAEYNCFLTIIFKKLIEQGLFIEEVPEAPNSMFV